MKMIIFTPIILFFSIGANAMFGDRKASANDFNFVVYEHDNQLIIEGHPKQSSMVIKSLQYETRNNTLVLKIELTLFQGGKNVYLNPQTGKPSGSFSITVDAKVDKICLDTLDLAVWHSSKIPQYIKP